MNKRCPSFLNSFNNVVVDASSFQLDGPYLSFEKKDSMLVKAYLSFRVTAEW